jgi:hypothetical protein
MNPNWMIIFWICFTLVFGVWFLYLTYWYVFDYTEPQQIKSTSSTKNVDLATKCGDKVDYFIWTNGTGFRRSVGFYPNTCGV